MNENNKKISLLNRLDKILSNDCVNADIYDYEFYTANELVINNVNIDIYGATVRIVLYLDELIIEVYQEDEKWQSYSIPYNFIDNFHIFLEE